MTVLVDTSVWSLTLRRRPETLSESERRLARALDELVGHNDALITGFVRQEILTGVKTE